MYIAGSDFDGTLNRGGVSERDRDAIHRFRQAGNLFGLVTGRDYWMYETLRRENIEFDFVLALNGAMAIREDGSYHYFEAEPNTDNCIGAIAAFLGENYRTWLSTVLDRERHTFATDPSFNRDSTLLPSEAAKLTAFTQMNTAFRSDEDARNAVAQINTRWGHTVNALQNGTCVDIPPAGVDKGTGIARYASIVGVPDDNIYCIGDNMNDMAMITRFHGCAVANARNEVKAAAEFTFDSVGALLDHILALEKPEKLKK